MLQFYMTPGSCSTGIHILLEELDLVFGVNLVDLMKGDHQSEAFKAINPKATIPVLVLENGEVLSDFSSIAWWLGNAHPKAGLLPESDIEKAKCLGLIHYVTSTIHGQGYTRIFTTDKYTTDEAQAEQIKSQGKETVAQGLAIIDTELTDTSPFVFGHFTIADAALFYVLFWADRIDLPLPKRCLKHYQAMLKRPVVSRVLVEEGYRFHL